MANYSGSPHNSNKHVLLLFYSKTPPAPNCTTPDIEALPTEHFDRDLLGHEENDWRDEYIDKIISEKRNEKVARKLLNSTAKQKAEASRVRQSHERNTLNWLEKIASSLRPTLISNIDQRFPHLFAYDSSSRIFAISAAFHPHLKLRWVPGEKRNWVKKAFIEEAQKISLVESSANADEASTSGTDDFFEIESPKTSCIQTSQSAVTIECLQYLEDGLYISSLACLEHYPVVKKLFRDVNATVPSSAPVEHRFSKGALIAVSRRNRLSDKHFELLLLLKANKHLD